MKAFAILAVVLWTAAASSKTVTKNAAEVMGAPGVQTACTGEGPSEDVALKMGINSCIAKATQMIGGTFDVNTMAVESEKDAKFHQTVETRDQVSGLRCQLVGKPAYRVNDGIVTAFVLCNFFLDNVTVTTKEKPIEPKREVSYVKSVEKQILVTSLPKCDDILIKGAHPRTVSCDQNPLPLLVKSDDQELIVRRQGYLPKNIKSASFSDSIEVSLEK